MNRFYPTYTGTYDEALVSELSTRLKLSELTAKALVRRGVASVSDAERFLCPDASGLLDPMQLPDIDKAAERIRLAVQRKERICVYGDYDADGITATAILLRSIRAIGGDAVPYIPSRHKEGYGLNEAAVRQLARDYVKLIVTVDNGIGAFDEIAVCHLLGVDVVVTDHHSAGSNVPECCAVVSASRKDSAYDNPYLCGAGVALKLATVLQPAADHSDDLALAAVATVADIVPLVGENRAIVACGLPFIPSQRGLRALLLAGGWNEQTVTEQTAAFLIAPRLNASGRVGDAMRGVELLLCEEPERISALAAELDGDNAARKELESGIAEQAVAAADLAKRAILVRHPDWNPGVIGIVASRLCEQYHRPAILFTEKDGVLTGSGRCPNGVNLFETLSGLSKYFVRFGGHARAAGVTMLVENFDAFCADFCAAMDALDGAVFLPSCGYEAAAALTDLHVSNVLELERLAPFGEGNPEPTFLITDAALTNVSRMGKDGSHLSATVNQGTASMRLVAFRKGSLCEKLQKSIPVDLVARPGVNRFRDRVSVELYEQAVRPSARYAKLFNAILDGFLYNGNCSDEMLSEWYFCVGKQARETTARAALQAGYIEWRKRITGEQVAIDTLTERFAPEKLTALLIFTELGFFTSDGARTVLCAPQGVRARELAESRLYEMLTAFGAAKQKL